MSFVFVVCSWFYLGPTMDGPPWQHVTAAVLVILLVSCLVAMLWTDVWPLRLVIVLALIIASELMAGVSYRRDSDSLLLAHSLVLGASSTLALSLRGSWQSGLFTGFLGTLVFGHTVAVSIIHDLGPITLLIVMGFWFMMLAVRHTAPKALDAYWSDESVRAASLAAQTVARERISASTTDARLLHDTVLRSLAVLARGGAGADPDEVRDMLAQGSECSLGAVAVVEPSTAQELASVLADRARHHSRNGLTIEVFGEAGSLAPAAQSAITDAAEECMVNAARHAGTDRVDVLVSRSGSLVSVLISDAGLGFDPDSIPAERLGVRHSVMERMGEVGGSAKVMSAPGRGTTVVLEVEAP